MNNRFMAVAITACAGLSLAACSAGATNAGTAKSPSPAAGHSSSSPATAAAHTAPGCAGYSGSATVAAPAGTFPIPPRAQVVETISTSKLTDIVLGSVTPSQISGFYAPALPRDGYKITSNISGNGSALGSEGGPQGPYAVITFKGHGYIGGVAAGKLPSVPSGARVRTCPGARLSSISKTAAWISFNPH